MKKEPKPIRHRVNLNNQFNGRSLTYEEFREVVMAVLDVFQERRCNMADSVRVIQAVIAVSVQEMQHMLTLQSKSEDNTPEEQAQLDRMTKNFRGFIEKVVLEPDQYFDNSIVRLAETEIIKKEPDNTIPQSMQSSTSDSNVMDGTVH